MERTEIHIPAPQRFDLRRTLNDHGWVVLAPNRQLDQAQGLGRGMRLPDGRAVAVEISGHATSGSPAVCLTVFSEDALENDARRSLASEVSHMLRLDEDMSGFYAVCRRKGKPWRDLARGSGRLLRSPSIFEDLVKVICTTNIQWGGTKRMAAELVNAFGQPTPVEGVQTFPDAHTLAAVDEDVFLSRVRLGYRGPYVLQLARDVHENRLDMNAWLDRNMPTVEIKKQLLSIKGIGSYAAASMLMLLGRYDEIPVDTVFRQFMADKYFADKDFNEAQALSMYDDWGEWKYLAYWFDMLDAYRES